MFTDSLGHKIFLFVCGNPWKFFREYGHSQKVERESCKKRLERLFGWLARQRITAPNGSPRVGLNGAEDAQNAGSAGSAECAGTTSVVLTTPASAAAEDSKMGDFIAGVASIEVDDDSWKK